jgi:hypothetical protein
MAVFVKSIILDDHFVGQRSNCPTPSFELYAFFIRDTS